MRLSIVVPIYGVEDYICQCADSLLSQSYAGIEFIFVNDGTTDRSMVLLRDLIERKYASVKDRIVILEEENAGVSAARQKGLTAATGDYVLFFDSDDWFEPDGIRMIMERAERTGADIIYYGLYKEYGHHKVRVCLERDYDISEKSLFIRNLFNYRTRGYLHTKCYRRSLFTENTICFSPYHMHDDIYMNIQLVHAATSFSYLDVPLCHYRIDNPHSVTSSGRKKRRMQSCLNMMDLYSRYRNSLKGSPVEYVAGDILMTTGWNSIIFGLGFYDSFPFLAREIRHTGFDKMSRLSFFAQAVTKVYSLFRR